MEKEAQASEIEGATPPTAESERGERRPVQSRNFRYGITVNAAAAAVPPPPTVITRGGGVASTSHLQPFRVQKEGQLGIAQQYRVTLMVTWLGTGRH